MHTPQKILKKPLLRGHSHQAAFFIALGSCLMLITKTNGSRALVAAIIYSLSLINLFGTSALYHRPQWSQSVRKWFRRFDHAAIFLLIGGSATPFFLLALPPEEGRRMLIVCWSAAILGVIQSLFWVQAPKWFTALLCVTVGWILIPCLPELKLAIGPEGILLFLAGGVIYTVGALTYALKRPNPLPEIFGYHEIFHLLVIIAAICHFIVIERLMSSTSF